MVGRHHLYADLCHPCNQASHQFNQKTWLEEE
jgi:hypothetical protein